MWPLVANSRFKPLMFIVPDCNSMASFDLYGLLYEGMAFELTLHIRTDRISEPRGSETNMRHFYSRKTFHCARFTSVGSKAHHRSHFANMV